MKWRRQPEGRGPGSLCLGPREWMFPSLACWALLLASGVLELASQELSAEATGSLDRALSSRSAQANFAGPTLPQVPGVALDEHAAIIASSLECDNLEIRGTLADSSTGFPEDLTVGAVVVAAPLRCQGATADVVVRAIAGIEYEDGSATFALLTYDLLQDSCSTPDKALLGETGLEVCILQEQLPAVGIMTSNSFTGQYTHQLHLTIAADDLQKLMLPGVGPEDVYIAYSQSPSSGASTEAICGLASYEAPQHRIDNATGIILATAPFNICAKACPKNGSPVLTGSTCTDVRFDAPEVQDEESLEEDQKNEDSPINFVEEDLDFYQQALIEEQLKEEEPSYTLSRSMIGLIVGCTVSTFVILVVAFVVVRCANVSNRSLIASYPGTPKPADATPQHKAYHPVSAPVTPTHGTYTTSPFHGSKPQTPRGPKTPTGNAALAVASRSPYGSVAHSPYGYVANTPVPSGTPKPTRPAAYSSVQEALRRSEPASPFATRSARAISPATPKTPRGL